MAKGRGNPVENTSGRKTISQQVVNPVDKANVTSGTGGAKMRGGVKQNPSKTLNQKVVNPSDGAAVASVVKKRS